MKTAAVIAEFNPFHNGHARLMDEVGRLVGPGGARVIVMSGHFTQRGEPALLDKWTRTRTALDCGADLVLELPFAFATSSAGRFAAGGVAVARATGVCRHLVFGSETDDMESLHATASILAEEPDRFKQLLRERLDLGEPFAGARIGALETYMKETSAGGSADASCLRSSNSILAVEYLIAIQRQQARFSPHAVLREGASYGSTGLGRELASATAIRKTIQNHRGAYAALADLLLPHMPPASLAHAFSVMQSGIGPVFFEDFASNVLGMLRSADLTSLEGIAGMGEGLAPRMVEAAARLSADLKSDSAADGLLATFSEAVSTRRFANTRISRAVTAMLTGFTAQDLASFEHQSPGPRYIRVLGFNRKGRYLLKIMRKQATLPVIMNASDFLEYGQDPVLTRMAALDRISTDLWMLAANKPCGMDFDTPPVMV